MLFTFSGLVNDKNKAYCEQRCQEPADSLFFACEIRHILFPWKDDCAAGDGFGSTETYDVDNERITKDADKNPAERFAAHPGFVFRVSCRSWRHSPLCLAAKFQCLSRLQAEWAVERNADVLDSFMKMPGAKPGRDREEAWKRWERRFRLQASSRTP